MKIKFLLIYGVCVLATFPYVYLTFTTLAVIIWPALYFDSLPYGDIVFNGIFLQPFIGYYLYTSDNLFIKGYGFFTILNFIFIITYIVYYFD
jgi:hypothetical protein